MRYKKTLDLIISFEGLRLQAYKDQAGIPTIGYGTIMYPDGTRVQMGDKITKEEAMEYLLHEVKEKRASILEVLGPVKLNTQQLAAVVSFVYNIGLGGFKNSTLLKRIRASKSDPTIRDAFMMWNKVTVNGVKTVSRGLTYRRAKEADVYFGKNE